MIRFLPSGEWLSALKATTVTGAVSLSIGQFLKLIAANSVNLRPREPIYPASLAGFRRCLATVACMLHKKLLRGAWRRPFFGCVQAWPWRNCFEKLNAPYRSGLSKTWIKVKNPKAPAADRAIDGAFWLRCEMSDSGKWLFNLADFRWQLDICAANPRTSCDLADSWFKSMWMTPNGVVRSGRLSVP